MQNWKWNRVGTACITLLWTWGIPSITIVMFIISFFIFHVCKYYSASGSCKIFICQILQSDVLHEPIIIVISGTSMSIIHKRAYTRCGIWNIQVKQRWQGHQIILTYFHFAPKSAYQGNIEFRFSDKQNYLYM